MSVQCKNCKYCYVEAKRCMKYESTVNHYTAPKIVNLNRQRECVGFWRRKEN